MEEIPVPSESVDGGVDVMHRSEGESVVRLSGLCLGLTDVGGGAEDEDVEELLADDAAEAPFSLRPNFPGLQEVCLACWRHFALK